MKPSISELQKSKKFWRQQAEGDRQDAHLSLLCSAAGLALAGTGIALVATGKLEGTALVAPGMAVAELFGKEAADEFTSAQALNAKANDRQAIIDAQIE